jgi:hypothetical protein
MTEQIIGEPKNTIRKLTADELVSVSGGDGGGGIPIPPGVPLGPVPYPLPPVEGLPC